jgi:hypothetical protein
LANDCVYVALSLLEDPSVERAKKVFSKFGLIVQIIDVSELSPRADFNI